MITRAASYHATQLFFFSFLVLFTELALIRWLGSNIIFLSYFSNFILLGSFFGIGMGFIIAKSSRSFYKMAPILLALLILFVFVFPVNITYKGDGLDQLLVLGDKPYSLTGFPIWITLPIIFIFVAAIMAAMAHGLAIQFTYFAPLTAYRLDILGAITGILAFSLQSYLHTPPVYWGLIIFVVFFILFLKDWAITTPLVFSQIFALLLATGALAVESRQPLHFWSPYYKIALYPLSPELIHLSVNNIPHQAITSVAYRKMIEPFYFYPYEQIGDRKLKRALIIGAGTGSDTAIALSQSVTEIDAVEIDPMIYQLGLALHPNHPYSNPKVHVTVNDGRAFLQQSHDRYDLILFALPDSLTLVSGQSSLRLESYLFTEESIQMAKEHLYPDGVLAMYNYYWQPWLIDRLANTLYTVFRQTPCVDISEKQHTWNAVLTVSTNPAVLHCTKHWIPRSDVWLSPATDNHPFLYLKENAIPQLYQMTLFGILFLSSITIMTLLARTTSLHLIKNHADYFFMGMAFLLLETKSIVTFSLLFGNTWIVNALVFTGILLMVYFAIETTWRFPKMSAPILYGLLLTMLVLAWIIPVTQLLTLSFIPRFIAATLLIFSPVYLANLIFTTQFQHEGNQSTLAFGINMIGAMIGGVLEYLALITGYHFLIILIGMFYTLAFLFGRRRININLLASNP